MFFFYYNYFYKHAQEQEKVLTERFGLSRLIENMVQ